MFGSLLDIYYSLPVSLQHVLVSAKGWKIQRQRFGREFKKCLERVREHYSWTESKLQQYRKEQLSHFLRITSESPFWDRRFETHSVNPASSSPFDELQKLPVLQKDDIKYRSEELLTTHDSSVLIDHHTSGTTGSGLQFWETCEVQQKRWATMWRYRNWHGLDRDTWWGYFGGRRIVDVESTSPPFWRYNVPGRQVLYSTYHISPETVDAYVEALRRQELTWLHGYPSALSLLAQLTLEHGLSPPESIRIVTTGGENLLDSQRVTIEEAFDCTVREHYGQAEAVANISECEHGRLHVDEDFSAVEFLPVDSSEEEYRIVGTNWTNEAFPLLRYDTGDIAKLSDEDCPCGRPSRVVEQINGRKEDYVVTPNGARIGRLDHIFKDMVEVRNAQIYQPERGRVVLRVVKGRGYDVPESEETMLKEARKRLGHDIDIDVEYRSELPRTSNGKIRFVISDIESMQLV